jgi:hypothetical protein
MFLIRKTTGIQSESLKTCAKYLISSIQKDLTELLNDGNELVYIDYGQLDLESLNCPRERIGLEIRVELENVDLKLLSSVFSSFIIYNTDPDTVNKMSKLYPDSRFYIGDAENPDYEQLLNRGLNLILDDSHLDDLGFFTKLFMVNTSSDRPDKLYPTVVVDEHGLGLGLCYSSLESIQEAIKLKRGVYHSRKRVILF